MEKVEKVSFIKTLKDTNYFRPRTYKKDFFDLLTTTGLANILTKTILAPLERWRIISQTQPTYYNNNQKFKNIF
jgi:hypothetical protein